VQQLPAPLRKKARVIYQSTTSRTPMHKTDRHLNAVMVGHLRDEKSPQTLYVAAKLLQARDDILITHVGDGLDAKLADQARATQLACPRYSWLGAQPHSATRSRIQRAHVLVHASKMEGGAHVVMEAVCSGTPVIASHIDGNVGMLGEDYAGYFPVGDAQALADLLMRCRDEPKFLAKLMKQCDKRAHLFSPAAEQASLIELVQNSLEI
jgi:putative glycosyltransferase (TIGR04348 family)